MSRVRIRVGNRYEQLSDQRRAAAEELASKLRGDGLEVELEFAGYKPGRRALTPVEWTSIFIGTNVAASLIGKITADVYDRTKRMLAKRKQSEEPGLIPGRPLGFVIYGPRGEELRRWTTESDAADSDGETHADTSR